MHVNIKGADLVNRYLESTEVILAPCKISMFLLANQATLSLTLLETLMTGFLMGGGVGILFCIYLVSN